MAVLLETPATQEHFTQGRRENRKPQRRIRLHRPTLHRFQLSKYNPAAFNHLSEFPGVQLMLKARALAWSNCIDAEKIRVKTETEKCAAR